MNKYLFAFIFMLSQFVNCFCQEFGVLKDTRDGKSYKTVKIGEHIWMAENFDGTRFRNGDLIPQAKTVEEWRKAATEKRPAWCYKFYGEKEKNKLYNIWAALDPRGLAPKGWHLPKNDEVDSLIAYYPQWVEIVPEPESPKKDSVKATSKKEKKDTSYYTEEGYVSADIIVPDEMKERKLGIIEPVKIQPGQKFRAVGWEEGTNESGFNAINYTSVDVNGKGLFPGISWWMEKTPSGYHEQLYMRGRRSQGHAGDNFRVVGVYGTELRGGKSVRFIKD